MRDAYAGADVSFRVIHSGLNRCRRTRHDLQQRLADLDLLPGHRTQFKALAIGQDDQADQALALTRNAVQVKLHQRLALAHPCAVLDQQAKPSPFSSPCRCPRASAPRHRSRRESSGRPGTRDMDDHAVTGRVQAIVQGVDSNTIAHRAAGEHFVGNVAQGQHWPA
ncbi:hypothetical protein Ddc_24317 [Ditylenchus destructor]|nr:hypothetical protein Ddc_24317 [Ditylenchus destructor]